MKLSLACVTVGMLCTGVMSQEVPFSGLARDPGVQTASRGAGAALPGLSASDLAVFDVGKAAFEAFTGVGDGLGPRFNYDTCVGCHSHPTTGGTSPPVNPQFGEGTAFGAENLTPLFITQNGPVREARVKRTRDGTPDGSVHPLFVLNGRNDGTGDASGCDLEQDDFLAHLARNNLSFRIPTPLFGIGLIEAIPERVISTNLQEHTAQKILLGIGGRPNLPPHPGTMGRFGWKAQTTSVLLQAAESYATEMGISNALFPVERDESPQCQFAPVPNDAAQNIHKFTAFMRFLAPPPLSHETPGGAASLANGRQLFATVGCALCHTPTLPTGDAPVPALRHQPVHLYSDLALHAMGAGLADDIAQGEAGGDEFRTAPLWGLGQRLFLLHDGRTTDLLVAIKAHKSVGTWHFGPSEANGVLHRFARLTQREKQDLLNFLRSL